MRQNSNQRQGNQRQERETPPASNSDPMKRVGAYSVTEYTRKGEEKPRNRWTRLGTAFRHADGLGYNIELVATPVDGKIVLRADLPADAEGSQDDDAPF
jgi:hypothetical protein